MWCPRMEAARGVSSISREQRQLEAGATASAPVISHVTSRAQPPAGQGANLLLTATSLNWCAPPQLPARLLRRAKPDLASHCSHPSSAGPDSDPSARRHRLLHRTLRRMFGDEALLPGQFAETTGQSGLLERLKGTRVVPKALNDLNREARGFYVSAGLRGCIEADCER